ncbi:MAG TPA: hypothetical protein VNV15_04295 [Opitutaceae bacterium]|jgi:hypothetical protein|nr:hypothetical protein [Opitutaceae bacterium]
MNLTQDSWSDLNFKLAALKSGLAKCRAVNVNTLRLKDAAQAAIQQYFRQCRPEAQQSGIAEAALESLDQGFQNLLKFTNGNNPVRRYKGELSAILSAKTLIDAEREKRIGESQVRKNATSVFLSAQEGTILKTLEQIVPLAALSYRQACIDLATRDRISYRGTANELREALRELLDHLAPDADVENQQGFKFEDGQKKPTMKQKVRFILRARGLPATAGEAPENAVLLADEMVGKLTRSTYNRSSISAHVSTARSEVCQMKMYIDSVLAELLEIHREH